MEWKNESKWGGSEMCGFDVKGIYSLLYLLSIEIF